MDSVSPIDCDSSCCEDKTWWPEHLLVITKARSIKPLLIYICGCQRRQFTPMRLQSFESTCPKVSSLPTTKLHKGNTKTPLHTETKCFEIVWDVSQRLSKVPPFISFASFIVQIQYQYIYIYYIDTFQHPPSPTSPTIGTTGWDLLR